MEAADPLLPVVPSIGGDRVVSMESPLAAVSSEPPRAGAGLKNLGNTCFLNSILQCLMHTCPLVQRILQIKHFCSHSGDDEEFCSICCLKELINNCLFSEQFVVVPTKFAENLSKIAPSLQLGEEEDAHEFLSSMLNSLDDCCRVGGTKEKKHSDDDSIVRQVFGGSVSSQLRCQDCGYCSKTLDLLLDLSLEIDDVDTIEDALTSYTKVELIEDQFTCEGCKVRVSMEKQLKLDRVPEVAILHLKRFKFTPAYFNKIDKHIKYPLELDNNKDLKYDLYAVVVHHGSIESGHYFCSVRSSSTTWHQMNDSRVTRVSEIEVLNEDAYILFYMKRGSSRWLGSLMETEMCLSINTSPISVLDHVQPNRSSSIGEICCISHRTMSKRFTNVDLSTNSVSSTNFAAYLDDAEKYRVMSDEFLTQSTVLNHDGSNPASIRPSTLEPHRNIFTDELTVEERSKRVLKFVKDPRKQGQVLKFLRGMSRSQRLSIMSCMMTHSRRYKYELRMLKKKRKKHKVII